MGLTRAFVALWLPEVMAEALVAAQRGLPLGRPVPQENLHLTLAFLGDLSENDLDAAHDALSGVPAPAPLVGVEGIGTFGGARPRALWAAVPREAGLVALHGAVVRRLRSAGLVPEGRKFVPHITLARFRHGTVENANLQRFIADRAGLRVAPEAIPSFALVASTLGPGGAVYEDLALYPLTA
ncbi:MAG: RNA 2',3'-cyclic phosphodiesterase [Pseudomonadota bacterium]